MSHEDLLVKAAITYAKRGWPVFPLHTPGEGGGCDCRRVECGSVGKHPRTQNGLKDATTDVAQVAKWWAMWPLANIGIACGREMAVIDVDPRHGGDESMRDLVARYGDELTETVIALTGGGGQHLYYHQNGTRVTNSASALGPGIDIRGDGGYVVAPPSLHASGSLYRWERSAAEYQLAPFPDIMAPRPMRTSAPMVGDVIPSGQRDEMLTSLAGSMRRRGMSEAAMLAAIRAENAERCEPPLPDGDLVRIARSIARYEPGRDIPVTVTGGLTDYKNLRKQATTPPVYLLEVGGRDVRISMATLINHTALRTAIAEQTNIGVWPMKATEWAPIFISLLETVEVLPAPDDASNAGVMWGIIRRFLKEGADEIDDAVERGRPYHDEGRVYFTGHMMRVLLGQHGFRPDQPEVWGLLRDKGVKATTKATKTEPRKKFWVLPVEVVSYDANE